MRAKTFFMLAVLFCIVLGIVLFISRPKNSSHQQVVMGQKFFQTFPADGIESIQITSADSSVFLTRGPDLWVVADRYNYPADFSKITDLVKKLRNAKIGRSFHASEKVLARLSMHAPDKKDIPKDQRGTRIVFMNKNKENLADIIIGQVGEAGPPGDTVYIRHAQEPVVYLIDKSFKMLDKKPLEWLQKMLIDIDTQDIARVDCYQPGSAKRMYTIERPEKGKDLIFIDLPQGKKTIPYKLEQIVEVLDAFRIEDVVEPGLRLKEGIFSKGHHFEYQLFDGTVYHLYPGAALDDGSENHFLKVDASYRPLPQDKQKSDAETHKKLAAEAAKLGQKLSAWTYIISKWLYNSFLTNPNDFFEKEENK